MRYDYASAQIREAEHVTEWDQQDVIYIPQRDGDLAAWKVALLVYGWTTQQPSESISDPADPATRSMGVVTRGSGPGRCR